MDLALCVSIKAEQAADADPEAFAELDGWQVVEAVRAAMTQLGSVRLWDTTTMAPARLAAEPRPDMILNLSEGFYGTAREAQAPALFEWLRWPYVGSDPVTLAIALDKWYTKAVLRSAGIPTPQARLAHRPMSEPGPALSFPLIVKPVAEGSGKGIYQTSVVHAESELRSAIASAMERFHQPVLIEQFVPGREFTVGLIGNVGRWQTLPTVEINFEAMPTGRDRLYGYAEKWLQPTPDDLICPARVSDDLRQALEATAIAACDALRIRDWARVDLRLDGGGAPNVLDVNPLPGILPGIDDISSFTLAACAAGLDFNQMIRRIIETATLRYRSSWFLPYHTKC